MKAYMSDRANEGLQRNRWQTIPQWDLAAQAEREAQRILAVTEPRDPFGPDGRRVVCGLFTLRADGSRGSTSKAYADAQGVRTALAEALRAFVVSR